MENFKKKLEDTECEWVRTAPVTYSFAEMRSLSLSVLVESLWDTVGRVSESALMALKNTTEQKRTLATLKSQVTDAHQRLTQLEGLLRAHTGKTTPPAHHFGS